MGWSYSNLNAVHLQLSSRCNAACPGCPRFLVNSPNVDPDLYQTDISIETFESWFSPADLSKIKNWIICGTHGDPIACKDLVEIVDYICSHSSGRMQINTNGGLRGPKFFTDLGNVLAAASKKDKVHRELVFSVDGLEDTNHLYRRGVKWNKVIDNIMAYCSTGAYAAWDFLRFAHNVHQVDDAKKLAAKIEAATGSVLEFRLKNPFGVDGVGMPAYNKDYKLDYVLNHHERPDEKPYIPAPKDWIAPPPIPIVREGSIRCNAFRSLQPPDHDTRMCEIFVDHLGKILPCCFVGTKMYGQAHSPESTEVRNIQKKLGDTNSLYHHSLRDILDSGALQSYSDTWNDKPVTECWNTCGIKKQTTYRKIDTLFVEEQ